MSATPRDLLKTHPNRAGEVLHSVALKSGQANGQALISGGTVTKGGNSNQQVLVAAASFVTAGALKNTAAVGATSLPSTVDTSSAQYRKVLLELTPTGTLQFVVGDAAASALGAVVPAGTSTSISIAVISLPPSFTHDSTALADNMIAAVAYDAG